MPELPEVETISRQLNEVLVGRVIKAVNIYREKNFIGESPDLLEKTIKRVKRRAKVIEIELDDFDGLVQVHLKMTGQLIFTKKSQKTKNSTSKASHLGGQAKIQSEETRIVGGHSSADWVSELPNKHTRVEILFEDDARLFFNDMRAFGWMKIVQKNQKIENSKIQVPDVVDEEFSLEYFESVLVKSKKPVKIVLLDQSLMGGVGNIYANDALNMAKILPSRNSNSLNKEELQNLYSAVKYVIDLGIKCGGASAANYVDTKGLGGTYQNHFLVYKRDGQICNNCGGNIVKIKLGGRGTFYCKDCQV